MNKITLQEQKEVYMSVITELVKEKDKYEYRYKHPLPKGWIYADGFPDILIKG
jgi:hypothetical protein